MSLTLRFNSSLELIPWAALPPDEQAHLRSIGGIDQPPAIVRALPGSLATVKLVDQPTANLLACLRTPQSFPSAEALPIHLRRLLLDGLLECDAAGEFASGPSAAKLFDSPVPSGGALSIDALRYASSLPYDDARLIASRLYTFHTAPCTATWKRALSHDGAVARWLGLHPNGVLAQRFAAGGYDEIDHPQWLAWHFATQAQRPVAAPIRSRTLPPHRPRPSPFCASTSEDLPFKLYISPLPEALPDAAGPVVEEAIAHGAGSFKAGRTLGNILRPDKLILYFADFERLRATAARLEKRLRRLPAHGIPFTCPLDPRAMLSWGSDPPYRGEFAGWTQGESWRAWIVRRLAGAILEARQAGLPDPWRFALAKVNADGVDTTRWAPVKTFWS